MSEKQFIGRVETKQTQYGELIKISFNGQDRELLESTANNAGYNNLLLKKSQTKNTYYLEIDTWKPGEKKENPADRDEEPIHEPDLPF